MPLTKSGKKVLHSFEERYGEERGRSIFYAAENKGTLSPKLIKGKRRRAKRTRRKG